VSEPVRVVIADDHAEVLMAVADVVHGFGGIEIMSLATTVEETVRSAEFHHPDLVLVDAWLRGGGAEAVVHRVRAVSPKTVVVALASAKELDLVLALRAAGAGGCYEKENLSAALPQILTGLHRG
jgi:DNA-binding NarL/FixJ family response regulator